MPSREYAEYLANTTLFHLGAIYHIFEKKSFMVKLHQFYDEGLDGKPLTDLWHMQLLLVIAFGKLFLRRGASPLGPPGATDFLRARKLKSDVFDLWDDPILRIEILCLMSLYLLTADIRGAAYTVIGEAMRIALSLGMNREIPTTYLDTVEYERQRRVWWTIYVIDRKLSINMRALLSVLDKDIDVTLPGQQDLGVTNAALNLHIKLASLEGYVMSAAYSVNGILNQAFITGIQAVFSSMTRLIEDFHGEFHQNVRGPSRVSRVAATLHIMYYQCGIMCIRPIIFVLLQQRPAPLINGLLVIKTVSEPVIALLRTCVGAATAIIKVLSILHEQDLIGLFLSVAFSVFVLSITKPFFPLNLQSVFSASFMLVLVSIAYPNIVVDVAVSPKLTRS